jgi:hypothetical protein
MNSPDIYTLPESPETQTNQQPFPEKAYEPSKQILE